MSIIEGVYPPIATPFDDRGRLNAEALAANIQRWNDTGLNGYAIAGTNGESALLEFDEVVSAVRIARQAASTDKLVIAGTGCQSTAATIRLTCACADAGADVALVLNPFFYGPQMNEAVITRHYETLAIASPIPILLYNMPAVTHVNMAPEMVARLSGHSNVVGIKDSAGNIGQVIDLVRLCGSVFDVVVGNAPTFLGGLLAGAKGGILALANVAPSECVAIWKLAREGHYAEAREIHHRLMPVARAVTSGHGVPGLKAAMDLLGYYGGEPRQPLQAITLATREAIRQLLTEAGLLA